MRKFTLLLTGPAHGIVGASGDQFTGHPEHYERVDVTLEECENCEGSGIVYDGGMSMNPEIDNRRRCPDCNA